MNKKAFTLAEVMVTLAVISVIAAVLLPAINRASPDNNKVMFKKSYYTLQRVISMMINDDYNYPSGQTGTDINGTTVQRGFGYTTATSNSTTNKFCYFLTDILDTVGTVTNLTTAQTSPTTLGSFLTADGISWHIYIPVSDTTNGASGGNTTSYEFPLDPSLYTTKVVVDVNGSTKGPNCTADTSITTNTIATNYGLTTAYAATCKDPDQFVIGIRYDGKLQVGFASGSDATAISILSSPTNNVKY